MSSQITLLNFLFRANDSYLISRWEENEERMLAIILWLRKRSVAEDYSTQVWIQDKFTCTADGSDGERKSAWLLV
jgi:hypothetical protein